MIKKALLPALALAAASVAVPAAAQSFSISFGTTAGYGYGSPYDRDYGWRSMRWSSWAWRWLIERQP